jgi:hypothetical protein
VDDRLLEHTRRAPALVQAIEVIRGGVGLVARFGFVGSGHVARPRVVRVEVHVAVIAVPMSRVMREAPMGSVGLAPASIGEGHRRSVLVPSQVQRHVDEL